MRSMNRCALPSIRAAFAVSGAWLLLLCSGCGPTDPTPTGEHQMLLDLGFAQLENERPGDAEATFDELAAAIPREPAAHANLAIARLRQQNFEGAREAADEAVRLAPDDGRIAAISAEVFHWSGDEESALSEFERAADRSPDELEVLYRLYEQAGQMRSEQAEAAHRRALGRLTSLRPENLVLLLARGRQALGDEDRATASGTFLRVGELLWQAQDPAPELLERVIEALEEGDLAGARGPAQGLENVLKITPGYQQGLVELTTAIQGVPISRLSTAPPATDFGAPIEVEYSVTRSISTSPISPGGVAVADLDRDGAPEVAWQQVDGGLFLTHAGPASATGPESGAGPESTSPANEVEVIDTESPHSRLSAVDLDNDGFPDLLSLVSTGDQASVIRLGSEGGFREAGDEYQLPTTLIQSAAPIDFDVEGDIDVALAMASPSGETTGGIELLRNALDGVLQPVGERAFSRVDVPRADRLLTTDFDRDGDVDLIAIGSDSGSIAYRNLRQGEFESAEAALSVDGEISDGVSADLDNDGWPDLVLANVDGLVWMKNREGTFQESAAISTGLTGLTGPIVTIAAFDADADGRLDLAAGGRDGISLLVQNEAGEFVASTIADAPPTDTLTTIDFDGDGDEDLLASGPDGLFLIEGTGAEDRGWLRVRLQGLQKGSSKNNTLGIGSTIEVRRGTAYQFREVTGDVTHFGLGDAPSADVVRVVWTNGVPQNRIGLAANQSIVEEQLLKGSCPFVYYWDGQEIVFGTDLLWGAPIGLPVAPGVWAGADPTEIVHLPGARTRDSEYDIRLTEELWEAAFFDLTRLWIVDYPESVEVASNLSIRPGTATDPKVLAARDIRPVASAWDAQGREVTDRIRERDEIYADGWEPSRYQGQAERFWTFTFDLGEAPRGPIRLLLDGWIFPTDASLNLAIAQRSDAAPPGPRLEVETPSGWETLIETMPFPAGKTKTMVVDTPDLPAGSRRLRIASRQWLSWDRIRWSSEPDDDAPRIVAQLAPKQAILAYRGFSALTRHAPNAPHSFDYSRVRTESPWLAFPGRYTRYGDVLPLLEEPDDRMVILGPGDELTLRFSAASLSGPPPGWRRTVFLESHGWDKDADRNTLIAETVEPLPFRAMRHYGVDTYPETAELDAYRERWLTRTVD